VLNRTIDEPGPSQPISLPLILPPRLPLLLLSPPNDLRNATELPLPIAARRYYIRQPSQDECLRHLVTQDEDRDGGLEIPIKKSQPMFSGEKRARTWERIREKERARQIKRGREGERKPYSICISHRNAIA
jgi:hypothetical protein